MVCLQTPGWHVYVHHAVLANLQPPLNPVVYAMEYKHCLNNYWELLGYVDYLRVCYATMPNIGRWRIRVP